MANSKEALSNELDNTPQETKDRLLNKSGIYSMSLDDGANIIYVGQSKNLLIRFINHKLNTLDNKSSEYNKPKYYELRKAIKKGHTININVLEYCEFEKLTELEDRYITEYRPPLNCKVPDGSGGYKFKSIDGIS